MKETITTTEEKAPFTIDTEERAAWLLRKLKAIRDEQESIKAATAARLEELEADYRALWGHFGQQLESWAHGEVERRRRKTITLPLAGASVAFREVAGGLRPAKDGGQVRAEVAVTLGFTTTPEPVTVPDLERYEAHARSHFESTGEILPGFTHEPTKDTFTVNLKPKKGAPTE